MLANALLKSTILEYPLPRVSQTDLSEPFLQLFILLLPVVLMSAARPRRRGSDARGMFNLTVNDDELCIAPKRQRFHTYL